MGAALLFALIGLGGLTVGVLVGRYYVPDDRQLRRSARHGRAYLRALSESLGRDPEAALAELRAVVEENVEDPEPYFAMAALFRSRGEHERAIRVHQALALRERDRKKLKLRALYELGLDFRAAGMPRRATRAMEEVLADEPAHEGALRAVAALYEEQGRWGDAATMWRRLAKHRGEPSSPREHHLRVAAAQAAIRRGELDSARQWLKEARALPEGESPHFLVAAAELATARDNPEGARERLRQALRGAPELVTYLWPSLLAAERELAAERGLSERARDELDDSGAESAPRLAPAAAAPALEAGASLALPASVPEAAVLPILEPPSAEGASAMASGGASALVAQDPSSSSEVAPGSAASAPPSSSASSSLISTPISTPISTLGVFPDVPPALPSDDSPAAAAARARVDALLRELAADSGQRLELVLARAALTQAAPGAATPALLAALATAYPSSVAAQLAAARLELAREPREPARLAAALAVLTSSTGPLAWALDGRWRCTACGKTSPQFAWRCAGCRRWAMLTLETGAPEPLAPPPRERRSERRRSDGSSSAAEARDARDSADATRSLRPSALPRAALDSGLSEDDLAARDRKRSLLGRAGGWLSGVWSGTRGPSAR
jgi:lipopolysaccharide biosynthesis regulator YciM